MALRFSLLRTRVVLCTAFCLALLVAQQAEAGTVRLDGRASPGRPVVAVAHGLQPGAHISLALAPRGGQRYAGIVIGGVHVVPADGRLSLRFRWPRAYFDCRPDGSSCNKRRWRRIQRGVVALGAPDLQSKTTVDATTTTRVAVTSGRRRTAARARAAATEILPGANACSSTPWMSFARTSGEGYGMRVSLVPTALARTLARSAPGAYEAMWGDLTRCVSLVGVRTDALDSLYKQLVCHALYAAAPALGGPTWDLEAWYDDVDWPAALEPWRTCHYPVNSSAASAYVGHIVHWSDDPKAHKTSWLVVPSGSRFVRNWIPTSAVFGCLKDQGAPGPVALNEGYLDDVVPDAVGTHASCDTPPPQPSPGAQVPASPQPPPQQPSAPRRVITVDNRVTNGMGMREDSTPARLTTQPWRNCSIRGCNIYGTERWSGGTYDAAVCQTRGDRVTNGHDTDPSDDANPERYESTLFYGVRLADGTFGYVSEVWIRAADRGGLGLPGC